MYLKALGYLLLLLSCVSFLLVFLVPFLNFSTLEKASLAAALYIFCEITWWLSVPLLGKEMLGWSKKIWNKLKTYKVASVDDKNNNEEILTPSKNND